MVQKATDESDMSTNFLKGSAGIVITLSVTDNFSSPLDFLSVRFTNQWYADKHTPIITKELFDAVQEKMISYSTSKTDNKEFAFTKLITCGLCGSSITADEKFKKQQNGNVYRYVYYGCCRMNLLAASRRGVGCHSGLDPESRFGHWIPAFARMTRMPQQADGEYDPKRDLRTSVGLT